MKKTFSINLGGTSFIIDEDAYELLTQYFETLSHIYHDTDEATEFVTDIEVRCAELLLMNMAAPNTIVTLQMAEGVIAQIGRPQDFEEVEIEPETIRVETEQLPPPLPPHTEKVQKRLFRDPENKLLGGVCSGIAAYLNIDPTWVRLATVALCFLSFSTAALVYFLLWIILPEANTPLQRMQMTGETPTFDNIGKTVTGMFRGDGSVPPGQPQNHMQGGFGYTLSRICAVIAKVILVIIGLICVPVLFGLGIGFIGLVVALIASLFGGLAWMAETWLPTEGVNVLLITGIGTCLAIGIPLAVLIWLIVTGSRKTMKAGVRNSLIIAWTIGLVLSVAGSIVCKVTGIDDRWEDAIEHLDDRVDEIDNRISVECDTVEAYTDSLEQVTDTVEAYSGETVETGNKKITIDDNGVKIERDGKPAVKIKK